MDRKDSFRARLDVFEHQIKAVAWQACVIARRQGRWSGIAGRLLVFSLLSLALPVRKVEAQTNVVNTRNIPVSLCTTSTDILAMSGLRLHIGEIICPIVDDRPNFLPKSAVDILRVNAFSFVAQGTVTVIVCSQKFDADPRVFPPCISKGAQGQGSLPITFTAAELLNVWGPAHDNDFGFVRIVFSLDSNLQRQGAITGLFLFTDR